MDYIDSVRTKHGTEEDCGDERECTGPLVDRDSFKEANEVVGNFTRLE